MIRRWAVLEVREGQADRIVSRHFFRRTAEVGAVLAAESWRNLRGEILGGRAAWIWAANQSIRLRQPLPRIHAEQPSAGRLWPDTEYCAISLPFEPNPPRPA